MAGSDRADSNVTDSFDGCATSDISIYQIRPTRRSFAEKRKKEHHDVYLQKIWVSIHSFIFILIALEIIFLLQNKQNLLKEFYSPYQDDYYQCCYCAWIAVIGEQNDGREIEYSYCHRNYKKFDNPTVCDIGGDDYCNFNMIDNNNNKVSTTSQILFIPFPKSYLYYGIVGLILVILYCSFICMATFKYNIRLSYILFVGNIVIGIQCYYNYIKVYQYTFTNYNQTCINPDFPSDSNTKQACYQNIVNSFISTILTWMVGFFMIYFIYPLVFYIFGCFIKRCPRAYTCSVIQSWIERILLYIGVIGGLFSIFFSFIVLLIVIYKTDKFDIMQHTFNNGLPHNFEEYLTIIISIILLITSLSVFFLPHCRSRCKLIIRATKIPKWKETIIDIQNDQYDEIDDFNDISDDKHLSSLKKSHSPLIE